jgi:predicted ribosome quality control (RQC) complex YloA/Tae2 family protein
MTPPRWCIGLPQDELQNANAPLRSLAPVSLSAADIGALVGECAPLVEGALVDEAGQPDESSLVLTLRAPGRTKLFLLLAARPRAARLHLVPARPASLPRPPPFSEVARKVLRGARLVRIRQVSGDRIAELSFAKGPARSADAPSSFLVHEMIGGKGRLFLLDAERRVEAVLDPAGGARFRAGEAYRFPPTPPSHPAVKGIPPSAWTSVSAAGASGGEDFPAPLHLAVALHYGRIELEAAFTDRRTSLAGALRKEIARARRAEEKVAADLAGARSRANDTEKGELLKGALGRLRRGMRSIDLENWFDPALPQVTIELDPALTPLENIEKLFRKARKAKRAIPFLERRAAELSGRREALARALEGVEAASGIEDLRQVEGDMAKAGVKMAGTIGSRSGSGSGSGTGKGTPRRSPARRFISAEGFEILVGRSARDNDELTLRMGRGNDLFLHVSGSPGAHVIVRSAPGKTFPLETILDAAQLALHYTLPERSRQAGARAEVDYTPVKHVRKPRGAKPGLVLLATHKTVRVRLDPARIDRLRRSAGEAPDSPAGEGGKDG